MSRNNTGNPIDSGSLKDLEDNAKNLDQAINSAEPTWTNRFGIVKKTMSGQGDAFDLAQTQRAGDFLAAQSQRASVFQASQNQRNSAFLASQEQRSAEFAAFITSSGYQYVGDYGASITLTAYNQIIRDSDGEFWRVSGAQPLPYTTTGGGIPEGGVLVSAGDAVLRQQLASKNGYRLIANQMAASAYGIPAPLIDPVIETEEFAIVDYYDGALYSRNVGGLYKSLDMGVTYTLVVTGKSPNGIIPTRDGEMLFLYGDRIEKSTGWSVDPQTATWREVLVLPPQDIDTYFLRWGFDGDGQKFIATHYGTGGAEYRVWVSTDAGDTFDLVYDQQAVTENRSHIHAACYDRWDDRFYFAYGHGSPAGIYYSDDDGATWTMMRQYSSEFDGFSATFTTMVATDFGIVCGTDAYPNGLYIIRRTQNPDDVEIEMAGRWDPGGGLLGFADRAFRDPDTGIVYVGFTATTAAIQPVIMACGSGGAAVVYRGELSDVNRRFNNVIAAKGVLLARLLSPNQTLRAKLPTYTRTQIWRDKGNLAVGKDVPFTTTAAGFGVDTDADYTVLFGAGAYARSQPLSQRFHCVGVGYAATLTASYGVAIGSEAQAGFRSIAIGAGVEASGTNSVVIGDGATNSGNFATAIGNNAAAAAGNVAVGNAASAAGGSSVSLGGSSSAVGLNTTAIGAQAVASGIGSTSIGKDAQSASSYNVSVGTAAVSSGTEGIAIGRSANAQMSFGIAVGAGSDSDSAGGIAIGKNSHELGDGIAIGLNAKAEGPIKSIAIGEYAECTSSSSIAIGPSAKATHSGAVSLGRQSETQRANSVCVGPRDIESTKPGAGIYLKSPNGTLYCLTINNSGVVTITAG